MTTTGKPAAATGLPNDKARFEELRSIVFDMEDCIARTRNLIRAADMAHAYGPTNKAEETHDAIGAVLDCAREAAAEVASMWDRAILTIQEGRTNV